MGAETGTTLPGCTQGRRFCHADMRPVCVPAKGTDPSRLGVQPEAKGCSRLEWWPFTVALAFHKTGTLMGRVRLGDRGSLSQGELVVCRSGKGRPRSGWRWGQYSPQRGGVHLCIGVLSPCPSSKDLPYLGAGLLGNTRGLSEAGLSRDRASDDGMYFCGDVPPGNMLLGTLFLLGEAWGGRNSSLSS